MKRFIINFEHIQKVVCSVKVEANSYEEAMNLFEKESFNKIIERKTVPLEDAENNGYHVTSVTENGKEIYKDIRKLKSELTV